MWVGYLYGFWGEDNWGLLVINHLHCCSRCPTAEAYNKGQKATNAICLVGTTNQPHQIKTKYDFKVLNFGPKTQLQISTDTILYSLTFKLTYIYIYIYIRLQFIKVKFEALSIHFLAQQKVTKTVHFQHTHSTQLGLLKFTGLLLLLLMWCKTRICHAKALILMLLPSTSISSGVSPVVKNWTQQWQQC